MNNNNILLAIIIIIGIWFGFSYNNLQTLDETTLSNWAQVENQLKRRNDLIPNLVATVKGYSSHEKTVMSDVVNARAKLSGAMNSKNMTQINKSNTELSSALSRLLVVVERYPDLKANKNFIALQDELAGTENRIAVARKDYNDSVKRLNIATRRFPSNIIANMIGITSKEYFEVTESEKQVPTVSFD